MSTDDSTETGASEEGKVLRGKNLKGGGRETARGGGEETPYGVLQYRKMMELMLKKRSKRRRSCAAEAKRMMETIEPRDGVEEMLATQMLWMHARLAYLSFYAGHQKDHRWAQLMHEMGTQIGDSFRRHAMALAEYRWPKRRRFVAVKQANIAAQQIVRNVLDGRKKRGLSHDGKTDRAVSEKKEEAVPAVAGGAAVAGVAREAEKVVETEPRA